MAQHIWITSGLVVFNHAHLHLSVLEAGETHRNCSEECETSIHGSGPLHVLIFLNCDWSELVEVKFTEFLAHQKLPLDGLATIFYYFLFHFLLILN